MCKPPFAFVLFPTCWNRPFLILEEVIHEYLPAILHSSLQGCIPWDSSMQISEEAEVCSHRVRVVVLHFALLPPIRILHSIISWSVQASLHLTSTFTTSSALLVSIRSSRAPFLVGSLIICIRKLSTHSRNLPEPYCVVLLKDMVDKVPQESKPVYARLLLVVWRQLHLHLPDQ